MTLVIMCEFFSFTVKQLVKITSNPKYKTHLSKTVDHSDVIGATPVGAAPTTPSVSTQHLASMD